MTSHVQQLRKGLQARYGETEFTVAACAARAGLKERMWGAYERGEAMPSVIAAVAMARVLGVTVEQLGFQRVA